MDSIEITKNNLAFVSKIKESNPYYFNHLGEGQTPEFFVLSCSDSRVSPSVISQVPLGHIFVHRNIANQVNEKDDSFSASLLYAIKHLKVRQIIIQGHTDCGGIRAAVSDTCERELECWLNHIRDSVMDCEKKSEKSLDELARYNVIKQMQNVLKHPIYKEYGANVEVLGFFFHVESGELEKVE